MRPQSIVKFERMFFLSLLMSVVGFFVGYDAMLAQVGREPAMQQLDLAAETVIGTMVLGTAVYLLLWFFIAHRASNLARWALTIFTGFGFISFVASAAFATPANPGVAIAYYVFALGAVRYLFTADARAWFGRKAAPEKVALD